MANTDAVLPPSNITEPAAVAMTTDHRRASLRAVRLTPPGASPRVTLRPLTSDPAVKVAGGDSPQRAAVMEKIGGRVPRALVAFGDRLEAVFCRGACGGQPDLAAAEVEREEGDGGGTARDGAKRDDGMRLQDRAESACRQGAAVTMEHHYTETLQPSAEHQRTTRPLKHQKGTSLAEDQKWQPPAKHHAGTPSVKQQTHASREKYHRCTDLAGNRTNTDPPEQHGCTPPDGHQRRTPQVDRLSEDNNPSRTFSIFETPRRDQPEPVFARPTRPRVELKRPSVAGRWQARAAGTPRRRRSELQLLADGNMWQPGATAADADTPHRHRSELKPAKVSDRWQGKSTEKVGRPRPEMKPSPVVKRRTSSQTGTPRWQRSKLKHPAAANRWQGSAEKTPRRQRPELKLPALTDRWHPESPRGHWTAPKPPPPANRGQCSPPSLLAPSPGGSGDKLRRVHRWLESSLSGANPTERRRGDVTPPRTGTSVAGSRCGRRQRLDYTEEEVQNLLRGVQKYGRDFKAIRLVYAFHPSRTTVDLYDKWRHMRHGRSGAGDTR